MSKQTTLQTVSTVTIEDINAAIRTVETVHNANVSNIYRFVAANEKAVLAGFNEMSEQSTIDEKFTTIQPIFSQFSDFDDSLPYLMEVIVLAS